MWVAWLVAGLWVGRWATVGFDVMPSAVAAALSLPLVGDGELSIVEFQTEALMLIMVDDPIPGNPRKGGAGHVEPISQRRGPHHL